MNQLPVHLKYQPPGAAAPTEQYLVTDPDTLQKALNLLQGKVADQAPAKAPLAEGAQHFTELLDSLTQALSALGAKLAEQGHDHCDTRRDQNIPAVQLAHLREFHSSPKQIANLLGCEAGYFDNPNPEEIICVFSPVRFVPAVNFFDIRQG